MMDQAVLLGLGSQANPQAQQKVKLFRLLSSASNIPVAIFCNLILKNFYLYYFIWSPIILLQALQYFEQLKAAEDGWKLCASTLTSQGHQQM